MKRFTIVCCVIYLLTICTSIQAKQEVKMDLSNKEKAVALLTSIETGDTKPAGYINPGKYIQHNLMVGDGLEGFGQVMKQLAEGSAKRR